jgi:membrane-associated protease RseP (regulator of RpoE activity)
VTDQLPTDRADGPEPTRADRWRTAVVAGADTEGRGELASSPWRLGLLAAGVVALGVFAGRGWLLVVSALFIMIFLHELGHFLTAKWTGMKVTEFFIGIGPKIWSVRRGETEYGVKLIPFVAYVRIIGMNNLDDCAPEDEPRTYRQQSFPKRMLVITAGSGMHFLQAFVLFIVVFTMVGVPGESTLAERFGGRDPVPTDWIVGEVTEGSAAARAGIRSDDKIVRLAGEEIREFQDIGPAIEDRIGDRVPVVVERDGQRVALEAVIGSREVDGGDDVGFLGVGLDFPRLPSVTTDPVDGVLEAANTTGDWMWETVTRMGTFFTGGLGNFADTVRDAGGDGNSDGPVVGDQGGSGASSRAPDEDRVISIYGVARIGADTSDDSFGSFLLLLAVVNISVGVLNLVPLLPLDGGHAAIAVYERVRSRRGRRHMADVSRLLPLTYAVVLFLGLIMVSSVYLDIVDPVGVG